MRLIKIILTIIILIINSGCLNELYKNSTNQQQYTYKNEVKNKNILTPEQQRRLEKYEAQKKQEQHYAEKAEIEKNKYEQIKRGREDINKAESAYIQSINQLKSLASIGFDSNIINSIINRQQLWIASDPESEIYSTDLKSSGIIDAKESINPIRSNSGIMNDIEYLHDTQPFYDQMRMRAIALQAMASRNDDLAKFILNNPDANNSSLERFAKNNPPTKYLNFFAKYLEQPNDRAIISDGLVHCIATEGYSLADAAGDIASLFSGLFAGGISLASSLSDSNFFTCQFRKGVQKYTIQLFYNKGGDKYRTKITKDITNEDWRNGINFDTTTWTSNLEYIVVRVVAIENGNKVEDAVVYKVDRDSGDLQQVNINNFISNVLDQYPLK